MKINELSMAALEELEARLLADLELVRQTKALIGRYQPLSLPVSPGPVQAAVPSVPEAAPPPPAYVPPPRHPNFAVADVKVAVRAVVGTLSGQFGIGEVKKQLASQHYREFGDSTIRTALGDLKEQGEILLVQRAVGRGGNRFTRPAAALSADPAAV